MDRPKLNGKSECSSSLIGPLKRAWLQLAARGLVRLAVPDKHLVSGTWVFVVLTGFTFGSSARSPLLGTVSQVAKCAK